MVIKHILHIRGSLKRANEAIKEIDNKAWNFYNKLE